MLSINDKVVIGVSGGADSICLLNVLCNFMEEYRLKLYVVHIHHGIRGKDANDDEEFVKEYCTKIPPKRGEVQTLFKVRI